MDTGDVSSGENSPDDPWKSCEENIPGNAIIKDSSVIHGPSNYNLHCTYDYGYSKSFDS